MDRIISTSSITTLYHPINRILIRNLINIHIIESIMYFKLSTNIYILFNKCRKYIEQDCMDNDRELLSNIR